MNHQSDQASDARISEPAVDLDPVAVVGRVDSAPFVACAKDWHQRERVWKTDRARIQGAGEAEQTGITAQLEALETDDTLAEQRAADQSVHERRATWIAQIAAQARRRIQDDLQAAISAADQTLRVAQDGDLRVLPTLAMTNEMAARRRAFSARCTELDVQWKKLHGQVEHCARRSWSGLDSVAAPTAQPLLGDLEGRMEMMSGHLARAATNLADIRAARAYKWCRPWTVVLTHVVVTLPVVGAWLAFGGENRQNDLVMGLGAVLAAQVVALGFTSWWRWRLAKRVRIVNRVLNTLANQLVLLSEPAVHDEELQRLLMQRRLYLFTIEHSAKVKALKEDHENALGEVRRRELALRERLQAQVQQAEAQGRRQSEERLVARRTQLLADQTARQSAVQQQLAASDQVWSDDRAALEQRWQELLTRLGDTATGLDQQTRLRHPAWSDSRWPRWTPAAVYASNLRIGVLSRPLSDIATTEGAKLPLTAAATVQVPAMLTFPNHANVVVRAPAQHRADALGFINTLLVRALSAFPGGGVRMTLIDPVGLGNSFAGLLDLKDHDDALLGSAGVLVEPERIDQGLQDLSLHLETVIQKHLRGHYESLYDYNLAAGELREAIRLVVVADFPAGFGERALERLNVIARSGPRCGVHLIMLTDERRTLPPPMDLAWLRAHATVVRYVDGRHVIDQDGVDAWTFVPESAPPLDVQRRIITAVGEEAHRSRRVSVKFDHLVPTSEAIWSLSSATSLRIPVGKRGAEGLQYFELGRGTAQHALIGGRTGSGKSTLFHVLITSAALWYAPSEVQFHLIDFKKGVEFKIYAAHHLPHAQVIAIESDREFGLSVLRQLDQELARRGDAFRRVGAQDLAAFRAASGESLPRLLLLIDEFQEFFTEDDAIARDAALLLDRFVRQGRAFGLHVVLGSQTLGGSYSMAKSSIGQMGVRIALPCNEADAHLLLHEDNDAARLLSRPGDAIYNDRAGLSEGNSPFQVCWLPEEQESSHLERIAVRAKHDGWRAAQPPVVFEGNGPSRLEDLVELTDLLAKPAPAAGSGLRAYLGQSSSLKGPAEVLFPAAAGGNLLIIGQNREAAVATCAAIAIGLAARWPSSALRFAALDGEDAEGPFGVAQAQLATTLPHPFVRHDTRTAAALLTELTTLLERRQSGADPSHDPVMLMVFALQRLRQLRTDDDSFSTRDGGEPPAERFAKLLANGPEYGIHIVLWCDSLNSLQRSLGRRAQRDFDARILFQMSATDSSELLDDDAASRLGLHTALLSVLAEGRRDKFRPFSAPTPAFLEQVRASITSASQP